MNEIVLVNKEEVLGAMIEKGQRSTRYKVGDIWELNFEEIREALDAVTPMRSAHKGHWRKTYLDHIAMGQRPSIFYCSNCSQCVPFPTNFCPACGSDNRRPSNE